MKEWIIQRIAPGSLMTHVDGQPLSAWGNNDQEVWKAIGKKMNRSGVQHITVTFKCKALDGGLKEVQNVYAVKNEICAIEKTPCKCKTCV